MGQGRCQRARALPVLLSLPPTPVSVVPRPLTPWTPVVFPFSAATWSGLRYSTSVNDPPMEFPKLTDPDRHVVHLTVLFCYAALVTTDVAALRGLTLQCGMGSSHHPSVVACALHIESHGPWRTAVSGSLRTLWLKHVSLPVWLHPCPVRGTQSCATGQCVSQLRAQSPW